MHRTRADALSYGFYGELFGFRDRACRFLASGRREWAWRHQSRLVRAAGRRRLTPACEFGRARPCLPLRVVAPKTTIPLALAGATLVLDAPADHHVDASVRVRGQRQADV